AKDEQQGFAHKLKGQLPASATQYFPDAYLPRSPGSLCRSEIDKIYTGEPQQKGADERKRHECTSADGVPIEISVPVIKVNVGQRLQRVKIGLVAFTQVHIPKSQQRTAHATSLLFIVEFNKTLRSA